MAVRRPCHAVPGVRWRDRRTAARQARQVGAQARRAPRRRRTAARATRRRSPLSRTRSARRSPASWRSRELLATLRLGERERGWAAAIKSAAEHLRMLTTLVVDAAKADSQRTGAAPRAVLARAGWPTLWRRRSRARARTKGLTAESTIADDLPDAVIGDPVRLRAALENLIDNAVKFTERGSVAPRGTAARARRADRSAADVHGRRQRHRPQAGRDQAAVPAVRPGERGRRAPLRRRRPRPRLRQAHRPGDGRRSHGREHARRRAALSPRRRARPRRRAAATGATPRAVGSAGASAAHPVRGGQSLRPGRAQHHSDRARSPRRFRRHRRGRGRGGRRVAATTSC